MMVVIEVVDPILHNSSEVAVVKVGVGGQQQQHEDDDGQMLLHLSPYERQRLERIRKNEEYLESLGLGSGQKKLWTGKKKTKRRKQTTTSSSSSGGEEGRPTNKTNVEGQPGADIGIRRSKRLKKSSSTDGQDESSSSLVMLSYGGSGDNDVKVVSQGEGNQRRDGDFGEVMVETDFKRTRKYATKRIRDGFALTEEEQDFLKRNSIDDNYLLKFKEFLVYHDKISDDNVRSVMRQVTKLARGDGIRYESPKYGWPDGCVFMGGIKVTPLSDIVQIMEDAQEAEDRWGRDRGNGWLLSHPLKKLLLFQQFALRNPTFLTSKCRIQEYFDDTKTE